jgi:chromosome segregation ATPase
MLAKTQVTIPQFIERQKMLESRAQVEIDLSKKADIEFEARQMKDGVERYKSQIEPLKEREQQLAAELNSAKAKVEELESRLDSLERAIENDRQKLEDRTGQLKTP